ncbi:hypothetical protein [Tateyamaria sp.]|uniref:hypothetical protein n=1 Tax=Tateyamaria sp. TaxID=1929288 RepID=UPI00329ED3B9
MYREIANYSGGFGDPVVSTFSFDPWRHIERNDLSEFEHRGVIVAILVLLMSAIDNSSHANVLASSKGKTALKLLDRDLVERFPELKVALEGFSQSEEVFAVSIHPIYLKWVQPVVR